MTKRTAIISITNEALQHVLNRESLLVKALLNEKERRSARRQAARMLRERQWGSMKAISRKAKNVTD